MGKKKWKRVKIHDLAAQETQERVLGLLVQAGQPEPESPEKRGSEMPQVER